MLLAKITAQSMQKIEEEGCTREKKMIKACTIRMVGIGS
jgi:hypothetical protein